MTMSEGVEIISRIQDHSLLKSWYDLTDASHFWFKWRMVAALRQLNDLGVPLESKLLALEVGCGTGVLREQFEAASNWTIDATDLDHAALSQAGPSRGRTLYYDIFEEVEALKEAYDVLILFDVLEHIQDTKPFIQSLLKHLKPGGLLLINVPAVQSLYSDYDEVAGHVKRYNKQSLEEEFTDFNLKITDMRYWGFTMIPVLFARKLLLMIQKNQSTDQIIERGFKPPNAFINNMFTWTMRAETAILPKPLLGSSLLMVGQKL